MRHHAWPFYLVLGAVACCYTTTGRVQGFKGPRAVASSSEGPIVRVRLTGVSEPAEISSEGRMQLSGGRARTSVPAGQAVEVSTGPGIEVKVGGRRWQQELDTVLVRPADGTRLQVKGRQYRGALLAFRDADGGLAVVNELGVEEYLAGVVPCEIGASDPKSFEAVKAQAVAARSFALARAESRKERGFQLYDSYLRDQEYGGAGRETELGGRAVRETRGEVMLYKDRVALALYHANCGGVTGDGSEPFLKSVRDTPGHRSGSKPFCADGKDHTWKVAFPRSEFEARLARLTGAGEPLKLRKCLTTQDRISGRVAEVELVTGKRNLKVKGEAFRSGFDLKSRSFEVDLGQDSVVIRGRGYGHGSGMCQDGASEMARRGFTYRQILKHYYAGVKLGRVY